MVRQLTNRGRIDLSQSFVPFDFKAQGHVT